MTFQQPTLIVSANQKPTLIVENFVIEPPAEPGKPDFCVYTCKSNGGCSVAFKTEKIIGGPSLVILPNQSLTKNLKLNTLVQYIWNETNLVTFSFQPISTNNYFQFFIKSFLNTFDHGSHNNFIKRLIARFQGSCFPPSFGGDCSGIPVSCQPCLDPCKPYPGKTITVNLNETGQQD